MYRVYRNRAAASYSSLYFFILLSLQFLNMTILRHTFLRNCQALKIETLYTRGQWADLSCIPGNQAAAAYSTLYFFLFLSPQFSNIKIFRHTFLRHCEALIVETWYTCGQWADVSCVRESGYYCLFVPLFLHVSFIFYFFCFSNVQFICLFPQLAL